MAGLDGTGCLKCSKGIVICPDASFSDCASRDYDVVFLPGGLSAVRKLEAVGVVPTTLFDQILLSHMYYIVFIF